MTNPMPPDMDDTVKRPTLAQRWWDGFDAKAVIDDALHEAGVTCEEIGTDDYDSSIELYDVPADFRLSDEQQALIQGFGFVKAFLNHSDKWETHYTWWPLPFAPKPGWRVSYPHKRGLDNTSSSIWVERRVDGWPAEWFDTGYAVVVPPALPSSVSPVGEGKKECFRDDAKDHRCKTRHEDLK